LPDIYIPTAPFKAMAPRKRMLLVAIAVAVVIVAAVVGAVYTPSSLGGSTVNSEPISEEGRNLSLDIKEGLDIQAKP
jgi:hypothetical protein